MYQNVELFGKQYNVYNQSCCSSTKQRTLYIELLNVCNARCQFCFNNAKKDIFDFSFVKDVVTELAEKKAIDTISLTGGEPLLYPNLKELLALLDSLKIDFYAITTNGILLKQKMPVLEQSNVKYINISRHHYKKDLNDKIFGVEIDDNIKETVKNSKKDFRLNVTITDKIESIDDIKKFIEYSKENGIKNILFRKEYYEGYTNDLIEAFFIACDSCKKSTKCKCYVKKDNAINIEYRVVNVAKEKEVEKEHKYIRNFVLKANNTLSGGWSEESIIIKQKTN